MPSLNSTFNRSRWRNPWARRHPDSLFKSSKKFPTIHIHPVIGDFQDAIGAIDPFHFGNLPVGRAFSDASRLAGIRRSDSPVRDSEKPG